jgi:hypothetical protein
MKLFVITSDTRSNVFVKAETTEEVVRNFIVGYDDPSFRVTEVTMELLMAITPDEFSISEETGF